VYTKLSIGKSDVYIYSKVRKLISRQDQALSLQAMAEQNHAGALGPAQAHTRTTFLISVYLTETEDVCNTHSLTYNILDPS
jgi:hypothetical protein